MVASSVDVLARSRSKPAPRTIRSFDVTIAGIGTAVPAHEMLQTETTDHARTIFPHLSRFEKLYANTGIDRRYACEPMDWYHAHHGWEERTAAFRKHALPLLERAARSAIADAGVRPRDIDALVLNTITGLAIPSLDAALALRLGLKSSVERLPIFGFGCGGGVAGLSRATRLAQTLPGGHVLFVTIDLCTLCMRMNDPSVAMFVSAALFGDGAAAVVLRNAAGDVSEGGGRIVATGEHLWPDTERIMGWDIKEDGFGVVLSPELPAFLKDHLPAVLHAFLDSAHVDPRELDGFLLHPGGRKVLETIEETFALPRQKLRHSWSVLRDFGNMSSPTALFVLQRALAANDRGRHLLAAFGPGFSAYFVVLDL